MKYDDIELIYTSFKKAACSIKACYARMDYAYGTELIDEVIIGMSIVMKSRDIYDEKDIRIKMFQYIDFYIKYAGTKNLKIC